MSRVQPDSTGYATAVAALSNDEVVAYPTETVYGLAVNPFSPPALERLFALKGRDRDKPILLIIAEPDQLNLVAREITDAARAYAEQFWPGPLSLIVPKLDAIPNTLTGGSDRVSVRCPACPIARDLCRAWGGPLTSTSANLSGEPAALHPDSADLPGVSVVIDGGELTPSPPSTVYDPDSNTIYREGVITADELRRYR